MKKYNRVKVALLLLCLSMITACTTKLVYNNLDWLTYWYIDDYIELTDTQEALLDPVLANFLVWHRQSELPKYINFLTVIKKDLEGTITTQHLHDYQARVDTLWKSIINHIKPDLVTLAGTLNDAQVEQFILNQSARDTKRIAEFTGLTVKERVEERRQKIARVIESFIGELTPYQQKELSRVNQHLSSSFYEWHVFRQAWSAAIEHAYTLKGNRVMFDVAIGHIILHPAQLRSPELNAKIMYNRALLMDGLVTLIASLTPQQNIKLIGKIENVITDIEGLL